jgi:hypothetical protein
MKLDNRDIESNGGINPNLHWYIDIHNFSYLNTNPTSNVSIVHAFLIENRKNHNYPSHQISNHTSFTGP